MRNSRMILSASAASAAPVIGASAAAAVPARSVRLVSANSVISTSPRAMFVVVVSRRCGPACARAPHFFCCRENGPDDARISGAAANLARHSLAHVPLARDRAIFKQVTGHDQHSGRAKAALHAVFLVKGAAQKRDDR